MSRTFCCCLPVRLGVFVLSFFQLIFAGAYAGLVWYAVIEQKDSLAEQTKGVRIAAYVSGGVYSLLAVAALLGLIGAIVRSRPMVAIYSTVLYVLIGLSTVVGVWFIVMLYRDEDKLRAECQKHANNIQGDINSATPTVAGGKVNTDLNLNTDDICEGIFKTAKWSFIVSLVLSTLISLYCAYIVSQYVKQLGEEQSYRSAQRNWAGTAPTPVSNVATSYYPHQPLAQQNESLLHPTSGYAYTDKQHSFGHQRGTSKESIV